MKTPPRSRASDASLAPTLHGLRRFMQYVWPYAGLTGLASLLGLLKFILPSAMALAFKFLTDRLVPSFSSDSRTQSSDVLVRGIDGYLRWVASFNPNWAKPWGQFNILMVTLIGIYGVWSVALYYRTYWAQLAGHRIILNLRTDLYQHITRLSHSFFQQRQSGGIVARLMGDIALAQNFVGAAMTNIWMDLLSCVFYIYVLFSMDWHLAAASMLVFPFYVASLKGFGKKTKDSTHAIQEAMEDFSGDVQERIAGIQVVKSFTAERREAKSFFIGARGLYRLNMVNVRLTSLSSTVVQWMTQMATLGIIWYGGYRIILGQTSVGTVVAFILLLRELYFPINRMSELNTVLYNSMAAINRVFEVFDIQPDVKESTSAKALPRIEGSIRFENVTFGYDAERPVLRDVNLNIRPGEVVGLVGPSGAGKSSFVQLVPRFYDPQMGRVLIDGVAASELQLRSLRSQVGMVAQETLLFSGSARENILYGRPGASEAEVQAATRAAHAHDFISALPEGYDTLLGERGAKLSGGQKQRLAIARVFLRDPKILVLDEATSALDSESETEIQTSLAQVMKGRTCIVIAHRLSTILSCDRIVVLNHGRIEDVGSHAQLLARRGLYARLYEAQFRMAQAS